MDRVGFRLQLIFESIELMCSFFDANEIELGESYELGGSTVTPMKVNGASARLVAPTHGAALLVFH